MLTVFYTRNGKIDFKTFENDDKVKEFYQTLPNEESIVLIQDEVGNNVEIRDVNLVSCRLRWVVRATLLNGSPHTWQNKNTMI